MDTYLKQNLEKLQMRKQAFGGYGSAGDWKGKSKKPVSNDVRSKSNPAGFPGPGLPLGPNNNPESEKTLEDYKKDDKLEAKRQAEAAEAAKLEDLAGTPEGSGLDGGGTLGSGTRLADPVQTPPPAVADADPWWKKLLGIDKGQDYLRSDNYQGLGVGLAGLGLGGYGLSQLMGGGDEEEEEETEEERRERMIMEAYGQ